MSISLDVPSEPSYNTFGIITALDLLSRYKENIVLAAIMLVAQNVYINGVGVF